MNSHAVLPCGSMRIVFQSEGDRIAHRVEILENGSFVPVLHSKEGRDHDLWPSSPTLQSVHVEPRPSGQVALLVGMAGVSHWSASVLADVARGRATFDIACRSTSAPRWLGSSYRWHGVAPIGPPAVTFADFFPQEIVVAADAEGTVLRLPIDSGPLPRTWRWGYSLGVAPGR